MNSKPTVLIVDDSPMMCRFLGMFLEKKFDILSYTDSKEALAWIGDGFTPDLIVTDLDMPGMNGLELIRALRAAFPNLPIMVVSGSKNSNERIKALEAGANDFLLKPFHPSELELRVNKLMEKDTVMIVRSNRVRQIFSDFMKKSTI